MNGNIAQYRNGKYCWETSSGKMTDIEEMCWDSNILVNIAEYEPCRYRGVVLTPMACNSKSSKKLENISPDDLYELSRKIGIDPENIANV